MNAEFYVIYIIAIWIAYFEGYWDPDSRAARNNNPGNLVGWSRTTPKDDEGKDIFPSPEKGWDALFRQVQLNISRRLTLREFFCGKPGVYPGYHPVRQREGEANCEQYAAFIARKTGLPIDNITLKGFIDVINRQITG